MPSLARNRDFVILWAGGAVSELGTSMSQLVFPLVGYAITHSTAEAGIATTGLVLGEVALRLPAGALVDRVARSRVLIATNVVAALAYGSLAIALLAGHLTLAHLVIAGFISGAADAFDAPARSATVRSIVPATQLPVAYTRLEARSRAARLIGPPLGGALYSWIRSLPFIVDAVSYLAEAFAITRLRTPLPAPKRKPQSVRADVAEGLRFVWVNVGVRSMMIWGGLINFAGSFAFVAVTLRLIQAGTRPAAIGLVSTAAAAAGLAGALVAPIIIRWARTGLLTISFTIVSAALIVPLAWTTNVVAVGALVAVGTFLIPANNAGISAYMVSIVPDELQGRVNSAAGFISTGLSPLGPVLAGVALALVGGVTTLLVGAAASALCAVPLLAARTVRELGRPDQWAVVE
jgi:MFS family permease